MPWPLFPQERDSVPICYITRVANEKCGARVVPNMGNCQNRQNKPGVAYTLSLPVLMIITDPEYGQVTESIKP
jgi:hypothetical protein